MILLAFFVVLGDLGTQIIAKMFSIENTSSLRSWIVVTLAIVCVIPLGMLRNIDSLTFVCTASMGFYLIMVFHTIQESSTNFISTNWTSRISYWRPSGLLQCLPIFSMALSCQMQLFEVLETMQTVSFDRQKKIIKESTTICTLVYILIGFFGYIAFLDQKFSGEYLVLSVDKTLI